MARTFGIWPPTGKAWMLDLLVALGIALFAAIYTVDWLADNACVANGRIVRDAGMDAFCEMSNGQLEPLQAPISSRGGFIAATAAWLGLGLLLFVAFRLFIRRGNPARPGATEPV